MAKDIITRKDIIEDQAMNIGPDYAKNMQQAIEANKQLVASLKEMAPLVNAFRKTDSQQQYIALKQQENLITLQAINANKLLEASEISLEKIKQAKLKTEKEALTVQAKEEAAKKRNTQLTIEEKVQNEVNNRALKQEARERLGLVSAYEKLNRSRTEAKNKLRDLLSAENKNTSEIKKAQKEYDVLNKKVIAADHAVDDFTKSVGNYPFSNLTSGLKNLIAAFGVVGGITLFKDIVTDIFNTTKEIQSLDLALKSVTGTQEEFSKQQSFLTTISEKHGLEIRALTKEYISFYVAAKDKLSGNEIQQIFEDISRSGSALGLSNEALERSFQAVNQMLSKGTVASEELRGQLAEAMPGAVQAMTKAVQKLHPELKNLTEKGLFEMIKDGKILASEVLPETSRQLLLLTGADKAEGIETLTKTTNRLSNEWTNFVRTLNESDTGGFFAKVFQTGTNFATDFLKVLKNIVSTQSQLNTDVFKKNESRGIETLNTSFESQNNNSDAQKLEFLALKSKGAVEEIKKLQKELREAEKIKNKLFNREKVSDEDAKKIQNIDSLKAQIGFQSGVNTAAKTAFNEIKNPIKVSTPGDTLDTAKEKTARDKAIKDKLAAEKKYNDDLYNLQKQRLERTIELSNEIAKDDEENDDLRIAAALNSQKKQIELVNLTKKHALDADKFVLDKDKLSANEKTRIKEEAAYKIVDIEKKTADEIDKINQFDTKAYDDNLKEGVTKIETAMNAELAAEYERFAALGDLETLSQKEREKAVQDHERRIFDIKKEFAIATANLQASNLQAELDAFKAKSDGSKESVATILDIEKRLSEAQLRLKELEVDKFKEGEKEKTKSAKEQAIEILQISQDLTSALSDLANAFTESKIKNIEIEIDKNNDYYERQIELAGNDERQKTLLENERAKKEKALEKEKRKEQHKQAVFNKAMAAVQVGIQTSLAVITALAAPPGIPFTIPQGILAGALGAIQLAAVLAAPIPKYKMGRKNGPAEVAVVGDGGVPEVISRPDGSGARTTPNKPTLTYLQKDDVVHKSVADYNEYMRRSIMKSFYKEKELASTYHYIPNHSNNNPELLEELKKNTEAIKKQKTNVQVINKIDFDYENYRRSNTNWRG